MIKQMTVFVLGLHKQYETSQVPNGVWLCMKGCVFMEMATITIPYDVKIQVEQYLSTIESNWSEFLIESIGIKKMSARMEEILIESEKEGNHPTFYTSAEEMLADIINECDNV